MITPECNCPYCAALITAAFDPTDANHKPVPGDLSICTGCANLLVFADNLQVRKATEQEMEELPTDLLMEVAKYKRALHRVKERGK